MPLFAHICPETLKKLNFYPKQAKFVESGFFPIFAKTPKSTQNKPNLWSRKCNFLRTFVPRSKKSQISTQNKPNLWRVVFHPFRQKNPKIYPNKTKISNKTS